MEYAILNDVEFVIEIAKKCAAIAAEHEAENGVSA